MVRIWSQDHHAQAQHLLSYAESQLMHAHHWQWSPLQRRQRGALACATLWANLCSVANAEHAGAEPERAWANVEPERADLGYMSKMFPERRGAWYGTFGTLLK